VPRARLDISRGRPDGRHSAADERPGPSSGRAPATDWHVIVIGAGPAGSAVAARLACRGLRTLLLDAAAMPRSKLCGSCLSAVAVRELEVLSRLTGDNRWLPAGSVRLDRIRLVTPSVTGTVPAPGGVVVSRDALDIAGVRRAVAAGADWLPATRVVRIETEAGGESVAVMLAPAGPGRAGRTVRGELVVLAAGLTDTVRLPDDAEAEVVAASRLGVGATLPAAADDPPPGELVMAVARAGYCGLVRLEDDRLDVAAALERRFLAASGTPAEAVIRLLGETGPGRRRLASGLRERLASASFRGTPPLSRVRALAVGTGGRVLRVGDAAGYVEPFTGEGMGWALVSARLCAEALGPAITAGEFRGDLSAAAARYAAAHRRHFGREHARCRRVALAVRRPWIVAGAAWLAWLAPALAAKALPLVVGQPREDRPWA